MLLRGYVLLCLVSLWTRVSRGADCKTKMKEECIIPDFSDDFRPRDWTVSFNGIPVKCDDEYPPAILEEKPCIRVNEDVGCEMVTLVSFGMNRSDTSKPYLQWLVYNIPVEDLKSCSWDETSGDVAAEYQKPGQGLNMYVFFLYCQEDGPAIRKFDRFRSLYRTGIPGFTDERCFFNPKEHARRYCLSPVSCLYIKITSQGQILTKKVGE